MLLCMYIIKGLLDIHDTDDVLAIQSLYGHKSPILPSLPNNIPSSCNTKNIHHFLTIHDILYVFNEELYLMKIIKLKTNQINRPQLIQLWLSFLPRDFGGITAFYQRPSREILFFIDNKYYMINYLSLNLVNRYLKHIQEIELPSQSQIHTILNFNSGKTYIFYNDIYYAEIDECTLKKKNFGMISKDFSGIPPSMDAAFRYMNGWILHFIKMQNFKMFL